MSLSSALPHIYYTISELMSIKNQETLENLNVKTIGYVDVERAFEIDLQKSSLDNTGTWIQLDLSHIMHTITGMKPYLIFGLLYWRNHVPALSVKALRQLNIDFENLVLYHHQLLNVRKKSNHYQDLTLDC